mgnify:CR=1 FL=1
MDRESHNLFRKELRKEEEITRGINEKKEIKNKREETYLFKCTPHCDQVYDIATTLLTILTF